MDISFGLASFDVSAENLEIVKTRKHTRGWNFGRGGSIQSKPLVHGDLIYFGANDGYVYCLDTKKREYMWTYRTDDRIICITPAPFGDIIIVPSFDGYVHAINRATGKLVWKYNVGSEMIATATVFGNSVFFTARNGFLYELDAGSGLEIKRRGFGDEFSSCPYVDEKVVIVGSQDGNLYCIRRDDFSELWRCHTGDELFNLIEFAVEGGTLIFASMDNYLYKIEIEDGHELWRFRTGKYGNTTTAVIRDGIVYYGSRDAIFYAIDFEDGHELWRFRTNGIIGGSSVAAFWKNYIFIDSGGEIFALDRSGKEVWRHSTQYDISGSTPVILDDRLYIGMWDCHMHCINPLRGEELWKIPTNMLEPSYIPAANDAFEVRIKKQVGNEEYQEDENKMYETRNIDMSSNVYGGISEYAGKSEYTSTSEYT